VPPVYAESCQISGLRSSAQFWSIESVGGGAQAKGGSGGTRVKTLFTQIACTRSVIWAVAASAAAGIKSRPVLLRTWVQSRGY
jgi:hypothetical protein